MKTYILRIKNSNEYVQNVIDTGLDSELIRTTNSTQAKRYGENTAFGLNGLGDVRKIIYTHFNIIVEAIEDIKLNAKNNV